MFDRALNTQLMFCNVLINCSESLLAKKLFLFNFSWGRRFIQDVSLKRGRFARVFFPAVGSKYYLNFYKEIFKVMACSNVKMYFC